MSYQGYIIALEVRLRERKKSFRSFAKSFLRVLKNETKNPQVLLLSVASTATIVAITRAVVTL